MIVSDDVYKPLHSWMKDYINEYCLIRNTIMPGKVPGTTYTWIFYLRNGLFQKKFMTALSVMFLYHVEREIGDKFDFQLTGLETAATPMVVGIPLVLNTMFSNIDINGFIVRKERKQYGLQNWFEGIPVDKPVLMVDDICNSSTSLGICYDVLQMHGMNCLPYAFTIVNMAEKAEQKGDLYLPADFKVINLFNLNDFGL